MIKSELANLILYTKGFKNTALENHLVATQNQKEPNTENAPEVKIHHVSDIKSTPSKDSHGFKILIEWMEIKRELHTLDELQTQL